MISRRKFLAFGLVASALISSSGAFAGERIDYSPAAFDAAQKAEEQGFKDYNACMNERLPATPVFAMLVAAARGLAERLAK